MSAATKNVQKYLLFQVLHKRSPPLAKYVFPLTYGAIMRRIQTLSQAIGVEKVLAGRNASALHGAQTHRTHVVAVLDLFLGGVPEPGQHRLLGFQVF